MTESAELVIVPCTARGHLAPTVEFAKLVVGRDDRLSVTVIIPKRLHDPSLAPHVDSLVASFAGSQRMKFVTVDNDYPINEEASPVAAASLLAESLKLPIRNHVEEMVRGTGIKLAGFLIDVMLISVAEVADELGVPNFVFWSSSAGFFSLMLHYFHLNRIANALERCLGSESLDLPGFSQPIPAHAFASLFLASGSDPGRIEQLDLRWRKSRGVVMNTSIEIEPRAIRSLMYRSPPVYPVGPVLNLTGTDSVRDGKDILTWLDGQLPSSVVFLCFGSFGSFSPNQVKEIASALETAGLRFLWVLRVPPPTEGQPTWTSVACEDPAAILPEGFLERTANTGRVIEWAPQADVLAHPAVGGFVSHCGWNSVLESLWFGVPIAAWPLYAEQPLNEFELVTELGLSVAVKPRSNAYFVGVVGDEAAPVGAKEIEAAMRSVMESESEVRKRVKETSEKFRKAVKEGGSSLSTLDNFVSDLFKSL